MVELPHYFITWKCYGQHLPGDHRGWRKSVEGEQPPRPQLARWTMDQLTESVVTLDTRQRHAVKYAIEQHARVRDWILHAVSVRTTHVHILVSCDVKPEKVREQFKANATRQIRQVTPDDARVRWWARGGDTQFIKAVDLPLVYDYIMLAQDRKSRDL